MNLGLLLRSSVVRFVLGGGITVLCEYVVFYILFVFFKWNLLIANSLSFVVGLGVSFLFNRLWAFRKDTFHLKTHHQLAMYLVLAVTNLLFNNAIVAGLQDLGLDPRFGKIIAIILIAVWNFIIYRKVIFTGTAKAE